MRLAGHAEWRANETDFQPARNGIKQHSWFLPGRLQAAGTAQYPSARERRGVATALLADKTNTPAICVDRRRARAMRGGQSRFVPAVRLSNATRKGLVGADETQFESH